MSVWSIKNMNIIIHSVAFPFHQIPFRYYRYPPFLFTLLLSFTTKIYILCPPYSLLYLTWSLVLNGLLLYFSTLPGILKWGSLNVLCIGPAATTGDVQVKPVLETKQSTCLIPTFGGLPPIVIASSSSSSSSLSQKREFLFIRLIFLNCLDRYCNCGYIVCIVRV